MKISVVIPTYNRNLLVRRAIDSVLAQRLQPDEIIVVDDGSDDDTVASLQGYKQRITLIVQKNSGVSAARNRGIAAARGAWIAFLDSDDTWHPQKLLLQRDLHRKTPGLRWSHTGERWIRNGREIRQKRDHAKPEGDAFVENLPFCKIAPSSVLIHRSLFTEAGCFDTALPVCEDYDLWLRFLRCAPVGLVDKPLVTKYAGHSQLSFMGYMMDYYRIIALMKQLPDEAVKEEIARKNEILKRGAQKHANPGMARFCESVARKLREFDTL